MAQLFSQPGTTPLSSIVDQVTELSIFGDDFLATHPNLLCWRQSPHDMPRFADSEVLTLALLQGCLGSRVSNKLIGWWRRIFVLPFRACVLISNGSPACTLSREWQGACSRPPRNSSRTVRRFTWWMLNPCRFVIPCGIGACAYCGKTARGLAKPARVGSLVLSCMCCATLMDAW